MTVVLGQRRERAYKTSRIRLPGDSVKIENTSSTVALHIKKKKRQQMNAQQKHDERDDEKYKKQKHKNKNIDKSRTHLNKVLHREDGTYVERFDRVIEEKYKGKQKVRSNAVTMVEITINLGGGIAERPMEEQNEVLTNMYEYLKDKYPEVIGAVIHNDETNPGLHMSIVPLTSDGRLSAKEIFSRGKLRYLQKDSLEYIQKEYPQYGFHRLSEQEKLFNGLSIEQAEALRKERDELYQQYKELLESLNDERERIEKRARELDDRESKLEKRESELSETVEYIDKIVEGIAIREQDVSTREANADARDIELDNKNLKLEEHKVKLQQTEVKQRQTKAQQEHEKERLSAISKSNDSKERYLDSYKVALDNKKAELDSMRDDIDAERELLSQYSERVQQQHAEISQLIEELKDSTRVSKVRARTYVNEFEMLKEKDDNKQFEEQLNDVDDFIASLTELTQSDDLHM